MNPGKGAKRGRPRRKASELDSSQEQYAHKKVKKGKKTVIQSLKKIDSQSKVKRIKLKSNLEASDSDDVSISGEEGEGGERAHRITFELFTADKVFAQILNRANKQPQFLIMLKNLLSGCFRSLEDKKILIQRKWKQLRNSNCTQDEYFSRQAELKKMETEEIKQIEEDIMTKLGTVGVKGFQGRDKMIQMYKQAHLQFTHCYVDEASWQKYHEQQLKLLNLLRKQNDFVSQDYKGTITWNRSYSEQTDKNSNKQPITQENEMDKKFNTLDTDESPQAAQFHFCKYYKEIHYDKIFDTGFRVQQSEKHYVDAKAMSWILESKSDEIYTNEKFQKNTYEHYISELQELYARPQFLSDKEVMDRILELTAYVLNSVHYYQKFKLKCDLLHPLDLLLIIQKLDKERRILGDV